MDTIEMYDDRPDKRPTSHHHLSFPKLAILFGIIIILIGLIIATGRIKVAHSPTKDQLPQGNNANTNMTTFSNEAEFQSYLQAGQELHSSGFNIPNIQTRNAVDDVALFAPSAENAERTQSAPTRFSETNVQVAGIDEPDILKTDGQKIYYSKEQTYYPFPIDIMQPLEPTIKEDIQVETKPAMPSTNIITDEFVRQDATTQILNAFPPAELEAIGGINQVGELLLSDNTLVIFTYDQVYGYDVTNSISPKQLWNIKYQNNSSLVTARLMDSQIYLTTRTYISPGVSCPIIPLTKDESSLTIPCTQIYHPSVQIATDATYTVMRLNPQTGAITNQTAFLGSSNSTTIYMSADAIYVAYSYSGDLLALMSDFITVQASDLFPQSIQDRVQKLTTYEISQQSKLLELDTILNNYRSTLNAGDDLKLQNELQNRLQTYMQTQKRQLEKTGITKLNLNNLQITASGEVPGYLLNQFSLDEYNGNLRLATTVGGSSSSFGWRLGIDRQTETANDIYILNSSLGKIGSILDLGLTERIYSARFIGDQGYLVTFRQIDPFYILDLSNPTSPRMTGELKIPGYSSYLHPLTENLILGVGEENNQVKLSIFNVSNPDNPVEQSKYNMAEYYSDVSSTHHAFLHDSKYQIFFIPAGTSGYIFSYETGEITLVKAIANIQARRALFINDYLYIVGDQQIVVLNQTDWTEVRRLSL